MLKECYSSIKRVLKEALSRMANTARRNLEKQTRLAVPVRTMLIVTLFVQLLCLGEPCAQAGDRVKARTFIGNSIDFGAEVESGPATMPIEVSELKQGAESGDALAQNNLAYLYTFGLEVPQDYREAAHWYAIAAAQGFAAAQYNLGALYERGLGVPRDSSRAAEWYRAAAEQGHVLAQSRLGLLYQAGWGLHRDAGEAMKWYRLAALQGDRAAQCNLAYGYFSGRELRATFSRPRCGFEKRRSKACPPRRIIWQLFTTTAGDSPKTTNRHCTGTAPRRSRDWQKRRTTWVSCMKMAWA